MLTSFLKKKKESLAEELFIPDSHVTSVVDVVMVSGVLMMSVVT